ncbi:serine-rich adhesin for platelets isoform X2 [Periplaneta americana]|uniref:serine-rich adhesin for platelets isoform X2 n=1 Tax=Periplaneta americana TaxID=6978 RepID=UPI0037E86DF6
MSCSAKKEEERRRKVKMDVVSEPKHFKCEPVGDVADEDDVPRYTLEAMANLLLLPDDVLLCIMKYLGPIELHNFSRITERFAHLVEDKNLWKEIDFRPNKLKSDELLKYVYYFKRTTKLIALRGFVSEAPDPQWREEVLTPQLLEKISEKCPELETLILDEHFGSALELGLDLFPTSIRHLSMKGCVISDLDPQHSYFQMMNIMLPFIKVLVLSNCAWVSPHDFMSISKCYQLEELRMDGCPQLGECVAYTSLAARFGFHSLKILDLRNTRMGDSDVGCFNRSRNLTHLYLQCPSDNEVSDGLCGDATCMDQPFREDFMESSDDDDDDDSDDNSNNPAALVTHACDRNVSFPPPNIIMKSLPTISSRQTKMSHVSQSECTNDIGSEPLSASASTSCTSTVGLDVRGDEYDNSDLPQASTSHEIVVLNAAGPSAVCVTQDLKLPQKQPCEDSDSSSDGNNTSGTSYLDLREHTRMLRESASVSNSRNSSPANTVHENGNRGTKRRFSSSDCTLPSQNPELLTASNATNEMTVGVRLCPALHNTSKHQDSDEECVRKLQRIEDSSPDSAEETGVRQQESAASKDSEPTKGNGSGDKSSTPDYISGGPCVTAARQRRRKMTRCCLFRFPHHEPNSESTISDLCIMSFVLKDSETDGAGYVRIISPHLASSRPQLHTLVVKNYKTITDASLQYLVKLNSLRYLDVSGTSVTEGGILQFKLKRDDVEVVSDHKCLPI